MSYWILSGSVIGIIVATLALVIGWIVVPPIVTRQIIENVQLVEGTEQYDRWVKLPQPLDFKVFIFNVTNVAEVQLGMMPKLQELGPYVYTQTRTKHSIRFTRDRERVSYYSQMNFVFNAEKSHPLREDDPITVLNMHMNLVLQMIDPIARSLIKNVTRGFEKTIDRIPVVNVFKRMLDRFTPFQSILQTVNGQLPALMPIINTQITPLFGPVNSFFLDTTIRKFLFDGVEFCVNAQEFAGVVCNIVAAQNSPSITRNEDQTAMIFSMFAHKNRTHDGLYEINTGIRRIRKLLKIDRWEGKRSLNIWKKEPNGTPSVCQFINGTDATTSGPFREVGDDFFIFSSDICRSVQLKWSKHTHYEGIDAFRYEPTDNFLNNPDECFCINDIPGALTDPRGCLLRGALDLTQCTGGPIIATMPHFYDADPRYNLMVDGLNPTEEEHSMYMDVEPNTGTPVRGGKKMQFNMVLKKIDGITLTDNFNTTRLFPVLWVQEGMELDDELVQLIKDDLVNVLRLVDILMWTIFGLGILMIIAFLAWFIIARTRKGRSNSIEHINPK